MSAGDRALLGLRAVDAHHPALIDGVVYAAYQRVGDGALVKAHAGRVHFDKRRVGRKRRALGPARRFQHQPRGAGLPHARRPVDDHMLGVGRAYHRLERADAFLLADDVGEVLRPDLLGERLRQADPAQFSQLVHFPVAWACARRAAVGPGLSLQLAIEIYPDDNRYGQLNE